MNFGRTIFLSVFLYVAKIAQTELYSAITDLEKLLVIEMTTIAKLDIFYAREKSRIRQFEKAINVYTDTVRLGHSTGADNPVISYLIMKNLSINWNKIKNLWQLAEPGVFQNVTEFRKLNSVNLPTEEDVKESLVALLRLQETYNLKPLEIANGQVPGATTSVAKFEADDCYQMGLLYAQGDDYYNVLIWMQIALSLLDKEEHSEQHNVRKIDVLDQLAYALYKQGNVERALELTYTLQELDPLNIRYKNNILQFELYLAETGYKYDFNGNPPPLKNVRKKNNDTFYDKYTALCRGEYDLTEERKSKLKCYYKADRPYLILAPLKVEVVHVEPEILLFRNVLFDGEIAVIQQLSRRKLNRATVNEIHSKSGSIQSCTKSGTRVAKSGWLRNHEHILLKTVNERVDHMTNLDLRSSEALQIVNYGMGGHYQVHFDSRKQSIHNKDNNNGSKQETPVGLNDRIATVLFYMSSPTAGGATVFPDLNLTVYPRKNDAIFWFNLLKNGEPDMNMLHSGCPVLSGQKWVANKWLHETGQEFRRPCSINKDE